PERTRPGTVSNAEINRELQHLQRAFSLAMDHGKIFTQPAIPKLQESAPRAGFFDREQANAVCAHLSPELAAVAKFAFITGWRTDSEILPIEWRNVAFKAGEVRIDRGASKNGEGRVFKMTDELREVLTTRYELVEALKRDRGLIVPWVFFRMVARG